MNGLTPVNLSSTELFRCKLSAFDLARGFVEIREVPGATSNLQILAMLRFDMEWPEGDKVPWCSAFVIYIVWRLRLPRSKDLPARSWLLVGRPIALEEAEAAFDVVILQRGCGNEAGLEVIDTKGLVWLFAAVLALVVINVGVVAWWIAGKVSG